MIIEEYGLRLLIKSKGVGIELGREKYETGDWAGTVEEAWHKGAFLKEKRRKRGEDATREQEIADMARTLVGWVNEWKVNDMKNVENVEDGKE